MSVTDARKVSDRVAVSELKRAEAQERHRDPMVSLPLADYRVSVSEEGTDFEVFYEHDNPNVPFEVWWGHPMHFAVFVDKASGKPTLVPGK
jgi:hypothetical protein